jgi:hypothetical protein
MKNFDNMLMFKKRGLDIYHYITNDEHYKEAMDQFKHMCEQLVTRIKAPPFPPVPGMFDVKKMYYEDDVVRSPYQSPFDAHFVIPRRT